MTGPAEVHATAPPAKLGAAVAVPSTKGFGFIAPEISGSDVFVHISAMERAGLRDLREGEVVFVDIEQDRSGKSSVTNLRLDG